jgi:hypothetical protein
MEKRRIVANEIGRLEYELAAEKSARSKEWAICVAVFWLGAAMLAWMLALRFPEVVDSLGHIIRTEAIRRLYDPRALRTIPQPQPTPQRQPTPQGQPNRR